MLERALRRTAIEYAKTFLLTPYEWGEEDHTGMDCSGLVSEVAQAIGLLPHKTRLTAHGLFKVFYQSIVTTPGAGKFVFYGKRDAITHVGIMINDLCIIEAGGGGSKVTTPEMADKYNAFVRIRPYFYRRDFIAICDPIGYKKGKQ